ncbi:carboxymuconolactone decarboxylase family protein [Paenibacillus sp. KQZ6P-2]|uniref:Carboxymuconolactone decarboxylase family protein n=1 Tax=Paenibacillus mangrovi TaxID=2931978 RepID=A0A9X1WQG1_9BACL|nr:carboxymuconolactone decarboxylase family protein [Paenibacillus mangrovi]MCJ8013452.1 carboxymuconolactone decarboxylase family protein [Paenibacillus mangrovi]
MITPKDKEANQGVLAVDPDFGKMAVQVGTEAFSLKGLAVKECTLLCLVNDVCNNTLDLPFQLHVGMALENGYSHQEVKEVLLHLACHAGYPIVLKAITRLKEMYPEFNYEVSTESIESADAELFDDDTKEKLLSLDPHLSNFIMREMKQVWRRGGLTPLERAYLSLAVDVLYQTLEEPFEFHVKLALRNGASIDQVRAVLRFMCEFGYSKVWLAFKELNRMLDQGIIVVC